jgi:hypothetical protein
MGGGIMLTTQDKATILEALKQIDVKKLQLDHPNKQAVKWFRFGSYIGLDIASEVIKNLPEKKSRAKKIEVKVS